ncbi:uncharacterized protein LOC132065373 isoform X1 [Lycium ferocissimum]|uniref:uncharacterized protein LOC132065373 isoform X1 n=2 Tax=Lycium ferocissimum TaxID=112874 RepID=UPI0028158B72|nr:uncharacterized protein LOC132065373 isoform X1 [Lycium ferocissimum]XP_059314729.1 uncharacterized protein LOC132065373 isoform X1 [Lycium ferocissimum]
MTEMDEPLDFEFEEPTHISPIVTKKKKKVIGLDDLLSDFYQVKNNTPKKESKRAKIQKSDESDDDDTREAELYDYVNKCQQQMNEISTDDQMPLWGLQVFGGQKSIPPLTFPELRSCVLLQSFIAHEVNSLVELKTEEGEAFLEGLLVNGWLLKLVTNDCRVEKCIGAWAFSLMLYSPKEELRVAACEFWCSILLPKNQVDQVMFEMEWLPNHSELMRALEVYGFLLDSPFKSSASMEIVDGESDSAGPPQNIKTWIKYVSVCCQARTTRSVFSTSEVEDLITSVICLFLDRQLLGLSLVLKDCLHSLISFFSDDVFHSSCQKIAKSLTCRVPTDVNCLRSVESVAGEATRSKHLRSVLAFHFLVACFDNKLLDEEQILRSLTSTNLKDKNCDIFKMYIHLVLAENWLFCNPLLKDKPIISEMWSACLRNCSCQITSTDLRSYASKVRSKASYLLQGRTTT